MGTINRITSCMAVAELTACKERCGTRTVIRGSRNFQYARNGSRTNGSGRSGDAAGRMECNRSLCDSVCEVGQEESQHIVSSGQRVGGEGLGNRRCRHQASRKMVQTQKPSCGEIPFPS